MGVGGVRVVVDVEEPVVEDWCYCRRFLFMILKYVLSSFIVSVGY